MISILDEIGYKVVPVQVLKAINYRVPQKRERLILVGVRKDIDVDFEYPKPHKKIYNLEDALKKVNYTITMSRNLKEQNILIIKRMYST